MRNDIDGNTVYFFDKFGSNARLVADLMDFAAFHEDKLIRKPQSQIQVMHGHNRGTVMAVHDMSDKL